MSGKMMGLVTVSLVVAGWMGWFAAVEVSRGAAFRDEQDTYERFSNAFTVTDAMDRIELVAKLVRRLTPETLPGAIRAFYDDQKDVFNNDFRMLMWYWAGQDPRGMLVEVQKWPEMRAQRMAAGEAVYWIVKQEGLAAGRAIFDQLPNHQRDPALAHLILAAIEIDQGGGLLEIIDAYDWRDERDLAAGIVVGRLLQARGPENLAEWVEAIPSGPGTSNDLKAVAFRAAQNMLMKHDHFEFLESWLERVSNEEWARNGGWRTIGVHLVRRDPERGLEWAFALREDQNREEVIRETIRAFASADRVGAYEWILEQEPSPLLDSGYARLVYEFKDRKPAIAMQMLQQIQDPEIRGNAIRLAEASWRDTPEKLREMLMEELAELKATADDGS